MPSKALSLLTINAGSSSIRFAVYEVAGPLTRALSGTVDRIGVSGTNLTYQYSGSSQLSLRVPGDKLATTFLMEWLEKQTLFTAIDAVGHRIVQGMHHTEPELVTADLLAELQRLSPFDPDHLPHELELIAAIRSRDARLPQVVCFDTAFHRTLPRVARLLPIPRRYEAMGIYRYGFHGLSYSFLMEDLERLGDPAAKEGRVILAHLGNGASMAAVQDGKSIDTSMSFTPTGGLVMSTRSGDLDPGVAAYLARAGHMTPDRFYSMVNHNSGLLGISETSSDMRDLLASEADDIRAAEAVALFCYQAKKWIGSYAAVLGGLDTLVFAGGIGENSPVVRERICEGLRFLGIELNRQRNHASAAIISEDSGRATVRVIHTDEDLMIARSVCRTLNFQVDKKTKA